MIPVGIEMMNVYGGTVCLDVKTLAEHRQLDTARFENLLMREKSVALPHEDVVSFAVNAARPILDAMSDAQKDRIEMLITCTESSFDFGKSASTYIHDLLGLNRNCRLFELKQACYSGTAGLQMAVNTVLSQTSPGAKVLVVAVDVSHFPVDEDTDASTQDWAFIEPSSGAGAVAMLIGENPITFRMDVGANGFYGYEVNDTCRPLPDGGAGDADLSLLSYLDCCENSFLEYQKRVEGSDYRDSFDYLAFHTPFGGMVKGAHRKMLRSLYRAKPQDIEDDFQRRVMPGMNYCQRVGNIMGATTALSLASSIDQGDFDQPRRIGCFSYGSGCCSEFFSGVASRESQQRIRQFEIEQQLDRRHRLSIDEYEDILRGCSSVKFGTRDVSLDRSQVQGLRKEEGRRLYLTGIKNFHREYEWL